MIAACSAETLDREKALHVVKVGGESNLTAVKASSESMSVPDSSLLHNGLSLRCNFSWTLAGNLVYSGCQWGMLVVLAKLGTPEVVGRFALGFAVTAPVIMFTNLQLRAVQATDAKRDYRFGDYLALRFITSTIALIAIIAIVLSLRYRPGTASVILAIGAAKVLESVSDVFHGLLQQHERMDRIAISLIIKGPLSLTALSMGTYLTGSVFWGSIGLAAVWALVLVCYDIRSWALIVRTARISCSTATDFREQKESLRPRWDRRTLVKLTVLSLPLGLTMMLISLNTNIPRYVIERYLGERELGIFAAMTYLMVAGTTVVGALGQSASPRLAKQYAAGNGREFSRLMLKLIGIGALTGGLGLLIAAFAGRWVLTVFYSPDYAEHADVFLWIAAAAAVSYVQSFLGCGMTAARRFQVQVPLLASAAAITSLACFWLIPACGLSGAALAIALATALLTLGSLVVNIEALRKISSETSEV